ncbi:uncharacterized protein BDCG_17054 [Blastomyces dermatitidis ER-3]|uniref:Uncharacterized protein n=1 Tax=Ajellomyces dermatitidis (strain ER-3 / ATCC MYA-2586) TaxID=559297 RepID=A0ABX2VW56_AJEDR|nr:uncharacterized protein BDCG_17054 [Blastomyces dermatitidis ER-3]OAT01389.1 hypothetical protein BDCG_17054 [Blastomyces dermatitidis ER-3]
MPPQRKRQKWGGKRKKIPKANHTCQCPPEKSSYLGSSGYLRNFCSAAWFCAQIVKPNSSTISVDTSQGLEITVIREKEGQSSPCRMSPSTTIIYQTLFCYFCIKGWVVREGGQENKSCFFVSSYLGLSILSKFRLSPSALKSISPYEDKKVVGKLAFFLWVRCPGPQEEKRCICVGKKAGI